MSNKCILIILLLISCSIGIFAQTSFYYYKGERIPLIANNQKVCVSIPKDKEEICNKLKNIDVLDKILGTDFHTFVIRQSDLKKISTSNSWKEDAKSVLLSSCYKTKDSIEVFLTPHLYVRLKKYQDINLLLSYAKKYRLKVVKKNLYMPLWYVLSVTIDTGKNVLDVANEIWESGKFAASEPALRSDDLLCSNDPKFNLQWGLYNTHKPDIDISVTPAWNYSTGKNVKIAILDTGVSLNHIDLATNISSLSYDTETGTSPSVVYRDHATHCAGIAAAVKDNNIQIAGVAPDATIISISNPLSSTTEDVEMKLADGINWAYQHGADIISNSWHLPSPHLLVNEAIHNAFTYGRDGKGCIITFAAGNGAMYTSGINYPANCNDTILAVGSIDSTGVKAPTSQFGTGLDIVAPGVHILSTIPYNSVDYKSGTSMACPHVAGVAALILQRNPELSVTQVNSIICCNAKKLSGVSFNEIKPDGTWNEKYGYGLVDAYSSVINTPEIVYIQNDTITGTRTIIADKIYVGRDVTDRKEKGGVILGPGNISLKAKNVIIKNSTTLPLDTRLIIGK